MYLNPAAYPASENLLAAPHCRKEENRNAHSTSCSPLQTHLDTNCPQLYLQAEQTKGRKIITTWITNNYGHSCQINQQSCVVRRSIVIYCICNAGLRAQQHNNYELPPFPASERRMNGWTRHLSGLSSPVSPLQCPSGGVGKRVGRYAKVH